MMSNGMGIERCVDTIVRTLPVCSQRQIAYSTFTIIQIIHNSQIKIIQFDNPDVIMLRNGKSFSYSKMLREINGKKIYESHFNLRTGDVFVSYSDGAEYAGVGNLMNFGWQRKNIIEYLELRYTDEMSAKTVSTFLADECNKLYAGKAGDDTTIMAVKIREITPVNIMFGPTNHKEDEKQAIKLFFSKNGKKIVCGGTTSKIVAEYLGESVSTSLEYQDKNIPPMGYINGVDLVTEGIITMSRVLGYARQIISGKELSSKWQYQKDAASLIAQNIFEYATDISFFVGTAINPAHQNPDLPLTIGLKLQIIDELEKCLKEMGKRVNLYYF